MKLNSISGVSCYVQDLSRTAEFYEAIGFRRGKEEPDRLTFYVNWFFVSFINEDEEEAELQSEARRANRGSGVFLHIKVDDIEDFYSGIVSKGMRPASESQKRRNGGREFLLHDPDGYKLVFFEKK